MAPRGTAPFAEGFIEHVVRHVPFDLLLSRLDLGEKAGAIFLWDGGVSRGLVALFLPDDFYGFSFGFG